MLKNNIHYWNISAENPEPIVDDDYFVDLKINSSQMETIRKIRETIRRVCQTRVFDEVSLKLLVSFLELDGAQYTEFTAYMNAFDVSLSVFNRWEYRQKLDALKKILKKYCESRFYVYAAIQVDDAAIPQAMLDKGASRAKSVSGKVKIKKILEDYGLIEVKSLEGFSKGDRCFIDLDRSAAKLSFSVGSGLEKNPDFQIKINDHVLIVEAKHLKESGGAQDKQLSELCALIANKAQAGLHFVAFLDGVYANRFFIKEHKYSEDALEILRRNPDNFFVNTAGFKRLVEDLLS